MASFTSYRSSDSTLTGAVDGTNTIFSVPVAADFLEVYVNGLQREGTVDYTFNGTSTFTFVPTQVPQTGDLVVAWVFVE